MKWLGMIVMAWSFQTVAIHSENDLIALAKTKGIRPHTGSDPVFLFTFSRHGQSRETLLLTAGGLFQTDFIQVGPPRCVSLFAAMPFNLGDGAVLKISLDDGTHESQVARLAIDAAHIRADRAWIPMHFDLPAEVKRARFKFEVEAGSRGDPTADWIGLAGGPDNGCLFAQSATEGS